MGTRPFFLIAGAGVLLVWATAAIAPRGAWAEPVGEQAARPPEVVRAPE